MILTPSSNATDLIKCFEGFQPKAYYCPGKQLTIGYGTTRGVTPRMMVTHEQALEFLQRDADLVGRTINSAVKVAINQNQFDALVSFTYNVGEGNFLRSSMLKYINLGQFDNASNEFTKWDFINKVIFPGLRNRRNAEKALFNKPLYSV